MNFQAINFQAGERYYIEYQQNEKESSKELYGRVCRTIGQGVVFRTDNNQMRNVPCCDITYALSLKSEDKYAPFVVGKRFSFVSEYRDGPHTVTSNTFDGKVLNFLVVNGDPCVQLLSDTGHVYDFPRYRLRRVKSLPDTEIASEETSPVLPNTEIASEETSPVLQDNNDDDGTLSAKIAQGLMAPLEYLKSFDLEWVKVQIEFATANDLCSLPQHLFKKEIASEETSPVLQDDDGALSAKIEKGIMAPLKYLKSFDPEWVKVRITFSTDRDIYDLPLHTFEKKSLLKK